MGGQLRAVLEAPPGAGKTTLVPLYLLDAPWLAGQRILLLEPRRLAARAAAQRMATLRGEKLGETVGLRTGLETVISPRTRVEVVTDGILMRLLDHDPELTGYGLVIFDEFHERALEADLGLALALEARATVRPELRLLVMSATLDGAAVAALLDDAPVLCAPGRSFAVDISYRPQRPGTRLERAVVDGVQDALARSSGDVLAFLPGAPEIRRAAAALADLAGRNGLLVVPLHGNLPPEQQRLVLAPASGSQRRVILATAIAETSLTLPGVDAVVDAGLARTGRYTPRTGMSGLVTRPVSQAGATQRAGRAGRLRPGICVRLWSQAEHARRPAFTPPQILEADLAPLALELAAWGIADPTRLRLLDAPPAPALASARGLLTGLAALDTHGRITPHGRAMLGLGVHPRLAHMLLRARDRSLGGTACALAALLGERDLAEHRDRHGVDLRMRLEELARAPRQDAAISPVRRQYARLCGRLQVRDAIEPLAAGALLVHAFPDRIAWRRADGRWLLSGGRGATLAADDALAHAPFLAVAELDDGTPEARIQRAAPLDRDTLEDAAAALIETREWAAVNPATGTVQARRQRVLGAIVLDEIPLPAPSPETLQAALLDALVSQGPAHWPWDDATRQLQARVQLMRRLEPDGGWPDWSDSGLLTTARSWLAPALTGCTRLDALDASRLREALRTQLPGALAARLHRELPTEIELSGGTRAAPDYLADPPTLAVRVQALFGSTTGPRVASGRVVLTLHLLSPARRPVAVTSDLASFWAGAWQQVRKEMRGRYPRHSWPDDPQHAAPAPAPARRPRS